jgi:glutathione S-transferase
MYQLYGGKFTRAMIVQMVMAEGRIDYDYIEVDINNNEHQSAEFLALNPAGHVPVLIKPDGEALSETPAINLYLCDKHGLTDLVPDCEDDDRGLFLSSLFFLSGDLEPAMRRYYYPHHYVLRTEDTAAMKQQSFDQVMNRIAVIEKRLQTNGPYHLGDRFSLADMALCFWLENLNFDGQLDAYPALQRCLSLVSNRPALMPFFAELAVWREEYRQLQAEGGGFK